MSGLIESATAILSTSESRLEIIARNVTNISTSGFKRQIGFHHFIDSAKDGVVQQISKRRDLAQGKLSASANSLDIAISGDGFYQLRAGDNLVYSRQGQFNRIADGSVVNSQGYVLQQAGGGDLIIDSNDISVLEDGTVLSNGVPVARLAAYSAADATALSPVGDSAFTMPEDTLEIVPDAVFRQGMIENSNVDLGEEMVAMMATLRQSEGGSRLVQVYDDLLGRALSTLGQSGK